MCAGPPPARMACCQAVGVDGASGVGDMGAAAVVAVGTYATAGLGRETDTLPRAPVRSPWAGCEVGCGCETAPREGSDEGVRVLETPPSQGYASGRGHGRNTAPRSMSTGCKRVLNAAPLQVDMEPEPRPDWPPREAPWAQGEDDWGRDTAPRDDPTPSTRAFETLSRRALAEPPSTGAHESGGAPLATTTVPAEGAAGIELIGSTEAVATAKAEALARRAEDEAGHALETVSRKGATERQRESVSPLRETPRAGVPPLLEGVGTCKPKRVPPWNVIHEPTRPFEARRANPAGAHHCPPEKTPACTKNPISPTAPPTETTTYLSRCMYHLLPSEMRILRTSHRVLRLSERPLCCRGQ